MEAAFRLRADPISVSTAREATRIFVASLLITTEDALVIVTELVSNAVQHGAEPIAFFLSWDGRAVHIEVSDDDPRIDRVHVTPRSASNPHGRGLALTDHLAASWGVHEGPSGFGKTVWAKVV
jgi:anti-sigma regulatory factor (Ser/Thr protein kinase)